MAKVTRAIIVGGGIGGAATALSLARQGIKVMLLEKAHEIGEIGAGIQLGPNAFSALDSLGVGEVARQRAVFTDHITMMDAVNAKEVVRIETSRRSAITLAVLMRLSIGLIFTPAFGKRRWCILTLSIALQLTWLIFARQRMT